MDKPVNLKKCGFVAECYSLVLACEWVIIISAAGRAFLCSLKDLVRVGERFTGVVETQCQTPCRPLAGSPAALKAPYSPEKRVGRFVLTKG